MDTHKIPSKRELELLSLVVSPKAGREVAKAYERSTGQRIPYGTVYATFANLAKAGWVSVEERAEGDRRVRIFKILGPGMKALNRARDYYLDLSNLAAEALKG